MNRKWVVGGVLLVAVVGVVIYLVSRSRTPERRQAGIVAGEVLPTGMAITPRAPRGAASFTLNPHLADFPKFVAGQPVTLAESPDGETELVLTSGYNLNNGPDGRRVKSASNEYVFVFDVSGGTPRELQVLQVPNTFDGVAWNPDGKAFYVSGGMDDDVHVFTRDGGQWGEAGAPIPLGHEHGLGIKTEPVAAGLAVTADGRRLLVANFQNDSVSMVDLGARRKVAELDLRPGKIDPKDRGVPGGEYPFWVQIQGNDRAYVSSPRDRQIVVLDIAGAPRVTGRIALPGQPNRMLLSHDGARLYAALGSEDSVAVIDTGTNRVVERIETTAPRSVYANAEKLEGSNPNGLALSPDGKTLYVTNGGANSIAVISLAPAAGEKSGISGLIPTGWYPDSVSVSRDGKMLYVVNTRSDPGPNPKGCRDTTSTARTALDGCRAENQYILQLTKGGFWAMPTPGAAELKALTAQVAHNDHYVPSARRAAAEKKMAFLRRHIHHVVYIIKENRSYDQVLGDLPVGNGDPKLTLFPRPITPNHHQLASQFVDLDNFYDSGEVSGDGWSWSTEARAPQWVENDVPLEYADRGPAYDFNGENRGINVGFATLAERRASKPATPDDPDQLPGHGDLGAPDGPGGEAGTGYLWDAALRAHLSVRNYGFFLDLSRYSLKPSDPAYIKLIRNPFATKTRVAIPTKPALMKITDPYFRGFDQAYPDYWRFQEWKREFRQYVAHHNLPALELVRLEHDHFGSFGKAIDGVNTVETEIADDDYAIGMLIQEIARSPYGNDTLVFIVEDDAQNGPDHVDAHRSIAFIAGPWVKQGAVVSTHYTTVNMLSTIEDVLDMGPMGINDDRLLPMADAFTTKEKPWSYTAIVPTILRTTKLPLPAATAAERKTAREYPGYARPAHPASYWAAKTRGFDFSVEDHLNTPLFNRILWRGLKGRTVPYPTARSGSNLRGGRREMIERYERSLQARRPAAGSR